MASSSVFVKASLSVKLSPVTTGHKKYNLSNNMVKPNAICLNFLKRLEVMEVWILEYVNIKPFLK